MNSICAIITDLWVQDYLIQLDWVPCPVAAPFSVSGDGKEPIPLVWRAIISGFLAIVELIFDESVSLRPLAAFWVTLDLNQRFRPRTNCVTVVSLLCSHALSPALLILII